MGHDVELQRRQSRQPHQPRGRRDRRVHVRQHAARLGKVGQDGERCSPGDVAVVRLPVAAGRIDTTAAGTTLESGTAAAGNGGVITFATKLVPSTTYALCETVMPGWNDDARAALLRRLQPERRQQRRLRRFHGAARRDEDVRDRQHARRPGGLGRTIGFWKNWASCSASKGNQKPVLDQTLAAAGSGITIGTLTLRSGDCAKAVELLDKSTIDTGKKMASDPAFNLAAQLLAAKLNLVAGAGSCGAAASAIADAQALLAAVHFNGITHDKLSSSAGDERERARHDTRQVQQQSALLSWACIGVGPDVDASTGPATLGSAAADRACLRDLNDEQCNEGDYQNHADESSLHCDLHCGGFVGRGYVAEPAVSFAGVTNGMSRS